LSLTCCKSVLDLLQESTARILIHLPASFNHLTSISSCFQPSTSRTSQPTTFTKLPQLHVSPIDRWTPLNYDSHSPSILLKLPPHYAFKLRNFFSRSRHRLPRGFFISLEFIFRRVSFLCKSYSFARKNFCHHKYLMISRFIRVPFHSKVSHVSISF
jgi:hypothetical protein